MADGTPIFSLDSTSFLWRATACLGLWRSFLPLHSEVTCRFQNIKKRKRKGKCQGTPCLASQTEMQRLCNLSGRWLELTCAHMLFIKLLKGFRISLHFEILKSNVYFLCFHTEWGEKKKKKGKKFPKDCIPKTRASCLRRLMYVYEESQHAVFKACRFIVS